MKKQKRTSLKLNKKSIVDMSTQKTIKGGKTRWCWVSFGNCPR
jgi:hypothetical protein